MTLSSITEMANELTDEIDIASAEEMLRLLRQTDQQMFEGYKAYESMKDQPFRDRLARAVALIRQFENAAKETDQKFKIILSGAGTSGRLAMLIARQFNQALAGSGVAVEFDYLIAGSDLALIKAQEGAEDDPLQGRQDLLEKTQGTNIFIYIGITCGFSAPYVAGQLDYAVYERNQAAFLIGFNPPDRARRNTPENWDKSFYQVVNELIGNERFELLNPVVGPEPITGSTRMKGGSATKMILEILFTLAYLPRAESLWPELAVLGVNEPMDGYRSLLAGFQRAKDYVYEQTEKIAPALISAGESLKHNGHIYYLGEDVAGCLGIVDASECPPTYGADFHDIRGFIENGWAGFSPTSRDLSTVDSLFDIGFDSFQAHCLPTLGINDLVVITGSDGFHAKQVQWIDVCKEKGARLFRVLLAQRRHTSSLTDFDLVLDANEFQATTPWEIGLAVKLVFNAITTAAHVFKGKVYKNRMVDLRISNNKLYYRSINIIKELMRVDSERAEICVLRAIYGSDTISEETLTAPISHHVAHAVAQGKIVPLALIMAASDSTYNQALDHLSRQPVIRHVVEEFQKEQRHL